jgi:hypothetical protein
LGTAVPELSFDELGTVSTPAERAAGARHLLLFLADNSESTSLISEAVAEAHRQGQALEFAPIPIMAAAAAIVFLLTINFEVSSTVVDGQRKFEWKVSRKASAPDQLKLIPGLGAPTDVVKDIFKK